VLTINKCETKALFASLERKGEEGLEKRKE